MNPHNARGFCWAFLLQEGLLPALFAPTVIGPLFLVIAAATQAAAQPRKLPRTSKVAGHERLDVPTVATTTSAPARAFGWSKTRLMELTVCPRRLRRSAKPGSAAHLCCAGEGHARSIIAQSEPLWRLAGTGRTIMRDQV
jgi:hypothetical protein